MSKWSKINKLLNAVFGTNEYSIKCTIYTVRFVNSNLLDMFIIIY